MNNSFKEFFPFKNESISVYENSIIVFDTNVLLDLYRYNKSNREKMFEILEKYSRSTLHAILDCT